MTHYPPSRYPKESDFPFIRKSSGETATQSQTLFVATLWPAEENTSEMNQLNKLPSST